MPWARCVDRRELDAMQRAYQRRDELLRSGGARQVEMVQEARGVTLKVIEPDGGRRVEWVSRLTSDPADGGSANSAYDRE
jgi:hypothetical protein